MRSQKVAVAALHPEKLGQLRAGQVQRNAGLESNHDRLGNEIHGRAGADQPGDKGDGSDQHGDGGRDGGVARRIAAGERADG